MPSFTFVARDPSGRTERGTLEADTEATLLRALRARGLLAVEVKRSSEAGAVRGRRRWWQAVFRPRSVDVEVGFQQLAFMLKSGLPLVEALRTCTAQSPRASMGAVWDQVGDRIKSGGSLSGAMAEHRCFPRLATTMVAVGEETGVLDTVLRRAAEAMERRRVLETNVKTALAYPAIVVLMSFGVVSYMMFALIPKLKSFLAGFGRKLPGTTQFLVDVSTFLQTYWLHGFVGGIVLVAAGATIYTWPPARLRIDRAFLRLPVVGSVARLASTALFSRALGTLLTSGVRLTEGLRVVEPLHANRYVASRVAIARERVMQGAPVAEPLAEGPAFLPMLASMVAVGESAGTLDDVLLEVASFHESRLEAVIRRLSSLLEPAIILVVGGIVGFIYVSFFMAIYAIAGGRS
jgi:type IV pilus assembly protein PilC